jgi:hypothetical protein
MIRRLIRPGAWCVAALAAIVGVAALRGPAGPAVAAQVRDAEAAMPRAPHGTRFAFEVIESTDAAYLGDTPSHRGRDGGLRVRPNVSLGDPVHRSEPGGEERLVGRITAATWERVSGGLSVEFHPEPFVRVAVGDEVWIDLNPAPATPPPAAAPATR